MQYTHKYNSPLGEILLSADDIGLTGLWLKGQKHYAQGLGKSKEAEELEIFKQAKLWLDVYFSGKEPDFTPALHFTGTVFQNEVCEIMCSIPYGETTTYSQIAKELVERHGISHMSAQAVGGAVGHNRISIIVPCHRVIGANGNLTGYAGGIDNKIKLLKLEGAYKEYFYIK